MVNASTLDVDEILSEAELEWDAQSLASAMPRLIVAARRTAATVVHGIHGRRRSGVGENFWQFRRFTEGEAALRIDWRRSARDDHLYVREQEWEQAHTVWLWVDRSTSMAYRSSLAPVSKLERGLVLALALADVLVRGGERVGLLGVSRPTASRRAVERLAEALVVAPSDPSGQPPRRAIAPLSEVVLVGDFLSPASEIDTTIRAIAARGARGHVVMIADPIEETFPFQGRTQFIDPENALSFTAGRAQDFRSDYEAALAAHREAIRGVVRRLGWTFAIHRTDEVASTTLLALHAQLSATPGAYGEGSAA